MNNPKKRSRNSIRKIVYGVGINDADYEVYQCRRVEGKMVVDWVCPYYSRWLDMIRRCYSPKQKAKQRNYEHCTTSEEWKTFSNFKKWMEKQDWEGKQLDKDLKFVGNTTYSEDTCLFITPSLNSFITKSTMKDLPTGVSHTRKNYKNMYRCRYKVKGSKEQLLGMGNNPYELHTLWIKAKKEHLDKLMSEEDSITSNIFSKNWFNCLVEESELNYNLYLEEFKYATDT